MGLVFLLGFVAGFIAGYVTGLTDGKIKYGAWTCVDGPRGEKKNDK